MTLIETAPAKVNLYLHVVGRRPDGYHLLDSLVVFAEIGDRLSVAPADDLSLAIEGPFGAGLAEEPDNLVLRAARALADVVGRVPSGSIRLEKNLPVASGIGGGSADAACALRLLSRLWSIDLSDDILLLVAQNLGADVPVCLLGRPMQMAGIGEILKPAPDLPSCGIVLVNPGVAVATQAVFRARTGRFSLPVSLPARWTDVAELAATLRSTSNDLEAAARTLAPAINDVLAGLEADPSCALARMSGSGATCFGLYRSTAAAELAATRLRRPGWWVWGGAIRGSSD